MKLSNATFHYFAKTNIKLPWGDFEVRLITKNAPAKSPSQHTSIMQRRTLMIRNLMTRNVPITSKPESKAQQSCPACTYMNAPGRVLCEICGAHLLNLNIPSQTITI